MPHIANKRDVHRARLLAHCTRPYKAHIDSLAHPDWHAIAGAAADKSIVGFSDTAVASLILRTSRRDKQQYRSRKQQSTKHCIRWSRRAGRCTMILDVTHREQASHHVIIRTRDIKQCRVQPMQLWHRGSQPLQCRAHPSPHCRIRRSDRRKLPPHAPSHTCDCPPTRETNVRKENTNRRHLRDHVRQHTLEHKQRRRACRCLATRHFALQQCQKIARRRFAMRKIACSTRRTTRRSRTVTGAMTHRCLNSKCRQLSASCICCRSALR
jgi:hypothetical protein